jgi:DNA-binding MarR family transcriptional regulator
MVAVDPDITRLVDRLIKRGLVKRSPGRNDRRVVEISITEKGLVLVGQLDVHAERMPRALLGHLGATKLRQLRQLLEAVISGRGTYP